MLIVITGPMFSGKSIELIRHVNRYKVAGRHVIVFKYSKDNRYAQTAAASYDGLSTWAIPVATAQEIRERVTDEHDVVVIDEVQFYDDDLFDTIQEYVAAGKDVVAAGLNLDFRGEPFILQGGQRSMADIMVRADLIHSLHAICTGRENGKICGGIATRTQRLRNGAPVPANDPLVQVGSTESYEARCVKHHFVPKN